NCVRYFVGAMVFVVFGFFVVKWTGLIVFVLVANVGVLPSDDVFVTVRFARPDLFGQVQISYDETRWWVLTGRTDDQAIQKLLLAAAYEENASVRVVLMDLLKECIGLSEVCDVFMNAVAHDPNDGVRLWALEGLKPLVGDLQVCKTLSQVLLSDTNPAVR